jgi:biotin carboxyl carrier protein
MYEIRVNGRAHQLEKVNGAYIINGQAAQMDLVQIDAHRFHLLLNHKSYTIELLRSEDKKMELLVNGASFSLEIRNDLDLMLQKLGMDTLAETKVNEVKAPMPGLVLRTLVDSGTEVQKGDPLLVLESMKMENVLKSPGSGIVDKIAVSAGQAVEKGQTLLRFR